MEKKKLQMAGKVQKTKLGIKNKGNKQKIVTNVVDINPQ